MSSSLPPPPNPRPQATPVAAAPRPSPNKMAHATIGGMYVYTFDVQMGETNLHSISHLMHVDLFAPTQLEAKATEACRRIVESRIKNRRRGMSGQRIADPTKINEESFAQDAEFFEVVMCDLFAFKILKSQGMTNTKLAPTIMNAGETNGHKAV